MVVAYRLECTLCTEKSFRTRSAWLSHLLEESHQLEEARVLEVKLGKNCNRWKKRALVMYARFPVGSVELLEEFCSVQGMWVVTNFVAMRGRPKVGIIFFESRKVLDRVYTVTGGPQIRVSDQVVEIKKGDDFLQLEWAELLSSVKWSYGLAEEADKRALSPPSSESMSVSSEAKHLKKQREDISVVGLPKLMGCSRCGTLTRQFQVRICQRQLIIDPDNHPINQNIHMLNQAFQRKFSSSELYPFQDWGYNYHINNPSFYVDYSYSKADAGAYSLFQSLRNENGYSQQQTVRFREALKLPPDKFKLTLKKVCTGLLLGTGNYTFFIEFLLNCRSQENYRSKTYNIFVRSSEEILLEAETDRLFQYLLTFDPRAKPLHCLARFTVFGNVLNLNMIQLLSTYSEDADNGGPPKIFRRQNYNAYSFLVIFFLGFKRLIPTPREVLNASTKSRLFHGVDIGFVSDDTFRQNWLACKNEAPPVPEEGSDEFVVSALEMAREFFEFCSVVLRTPDFILNLKDAEILTPTPGISGQPKKKARLSRNLTHSNLTSEEAIKVKTTLSDNINRSGDGRANGVEASHEKKSSGPVFLHPLMVHACLQLTGNDLAGYQCRVFERCAKNLVALIDGWKAGCESQVNLVSALEFSKEVREGIASTAKSRSNYRVEQDNGSETKAMPSGVSSVTMNSEFVKVTSFKL